MSRKEPRVSAGARQNDTLFEYEALKKKFLHANKAITKLNSTLSIRIEELNAELSTLYVENLRLRTSELALAAQLKRERERSRKLLVDTETAAMNLTKQLENLRQSYKIDTLPPTPPTPPSPRARRPPPVINADAQIGRLSRPPNVPEIHEEDEPAVSSSESEPDKPNPFQTRGTTKSRSPGSRTARQTRLGSPPLHIDLGTHRKKQSRRQSGLLSGNNEVMTLERPPSPTLISPILKAAAFVQEEGENNDVREATAKHVIKTNHRKREFPDKELLGDDRAILNAIDVKPRERKRPRDQDTAIRSDQQSKHVSRMALQPIDNTVQDPGGIRNTIMKALAVPLPSTSCTMSTQPLVTPSPSNPLDAETPASSNRERRARKSVNYAEPKLNTKMRKPDPPPGGEVVSRKKRSSAAAVMTTRDADVVTNPDSDTGAKTSPEHQHHATGFNSPSYSPGQVVSSSSTTAASSKKKSRPRPPSDDEDSSDGAVADEEYMPPGRSGWINLEARKRIASTRRTIPSAPNSDIDIGTDARRHSIAV